MVSIPNTWGVALSLGYPAAFFFLLALLILVPLRSLLRDLVPMRVLGIILPQYLPTIVTPWWVRNVFPSRGVPGDCPSLEGLDGFRDTVGDLPLWLPRQGSVQSLKAWVLRRGFLLIVRSLAERPWPGRPSFGSSPLGRLTPSTASAPHCLSRARVPLV